MGVCPSKKLPVFPIRWAFKTNADNTIELNLNASEKQQGNKDFIVQYSLRGKDIQDGLLLYEGEEENFFLMMMQPPERLKPKQIPPREFIFLVDVSGSMSGFPLDVSKEMMDKLLHELRPEDLFNILVFAGHSGFFADQSVPATKENIDSAINSIHTLQGAGGTRLLDAVQKAMSVHKNPDLARSFVIITDGYIDFEASVFDYMSDNLGDANFFAMGIGTGVNRHLIEGIAHVGMSEPFVITDKEQAAAAAQEFKAYIQNPLLTNIKMVPLGVEVMI